MGNAEYDTLYDNVRSSESSFLYGINQKLWKIKYTILLLQESTRNLT